MKRFPPSRLALLLPVLLCAGPRPAAAQLSNPAQLNTPGANLGPGASPRAAKREPAPPALPGSRAEPTAVAPPSKVPTDMPPTDALFDAINRGDLATAKDAIGRGADINGTNILGLTPLELSVDLGRNEISFLLLSLRGGSGYSTANGPDSKPASAKPPGRAERLAAERAERAERAKATRRTAVEGPPPAPQTPRLFAGDGGTPAPQAGFLGFGGATTR